MFDCDQISELVKFEVLPSARLALRISLLELALVGFIVVQQSLGQLHFKAEQYICIWSTFIFNGQA